MRNLSSDPIVFNNIYTKKCGYGYNPFWLSQTLKRKGNKNKYSIGSFHIYVQYLYIKGNYKMVAQEL
jgi:hypothetical protein